MRCISPGLLALPVSSLDTMVPTLERKVVGSFSVVGVSSLSTTGGNPPTLPRSAASWISFSFRSFSFPPPFFGFVSDGVKTELAFTSWYMMVSALS